MRKNKNIIIKNGIRFRKCSGECGRILEENIDNFYWKNQENNFFAKCINCLLDNGKIYYCKNKNIINKNHQNQYKKIKSNKVKNEVYKKRKREYVKEKRKNDPSYKLRQNFGRHVRALLKQNNSSKNNISIVNYLGYTTEELKLWLESQWEPWMNWNNYGPASTKQRTWQIDHIIPQSKLPYTSMGDKNFKKCWSLSNLRPLEAIANIKKSNKI